MGATRFRSSAGKMGSVAEVHRCCFGCAFPTAAAPSAFFTPLSERTSMPSPFVSPPEANFLPPAAPPASPLEWPPQALLVQDSSMQAWPPVWAGAWPLAWLLAGLRLMSSEEPEVDVGLSLWEAAPQSQGRPVLGQICTSQLHMS